ncbi:MAG TPA: deoxyribose-phosphate aldolase, partial [Actinomycetaceae bacterium]|nr:deoxyribose-phosphate aldolase [Actinomycetaceae bacterium]
MTPPAVTDAAEPRATRLLGSDPTDRSLRRHLAQLPGVDGVGLTERAAQLATRSLKGDSKRRALDLAVSLIDLTTLEGADTAGRIRSLVAKARQPDLEDPGCPRPAAVCVY